MTAALKAAFSIGILPESFWNLTPWQLKCCITANSEKVVNDHDHKAWIMWHTALLGRVRKMPPLSDFLSVKKKKPVKGIDEADIMRRFKAYQKKRDKKKAKT